MTTSPRIFDCDQHMYETRDAFTRHLDPEFLGQAITTVKLANGKEVILAGDRVVVALEPEFGEAYVCDTKALYANLHSLNLYMEEEWGFGADGRIFSPATLSLRDVDLAVKELDDVLARGARFILLPTGPAYGRSPGDPHFDAF